MVYSDVNLCQFDEKLREAISLGFLLLLCSPSFAEDAILSQKDCEIVRSFEEASNIRFSEDFVQSVHKSTNCLGETVGGECRHNVKRWPFDMVIADVGTEYLTSDELSQKFSATIEESLDLVTRQTPVKHFYSLNEKVKGIIYYQIIEESELQIDFDEYMETFIAPREWGFVLQRRSLFREFMRDDVASCMELSQSSNAGRIGISTIWIKSDVSEAELVQCIITGTFNAFGLGDSEDSLSFMKSDIDDKSYVTGISEIGLLKLRLLYSDKVVAGMNEDRTHDAIDSLLSSSCGPN